MTEEAQVIEVDSEDLDVFDEEETTEEVTEPDDSDVEGSEDEAETKEPQKGDEDEGEPPASEKQKSSDEKVVPLSVLQAIRRENQEIKAKLKSIEEAPDPVINPKGFTKHIQTANDRARLQDRIDDSREIALDVYPDFEEKEQLFLEEITAKDENGKLKIINQPLLDEMNAARNPAKFAYERGQKRAVLLERSSDDYETKVRNRIIAEMKSKRPDFDFSSLAPDLTNVTATSKNTNRVEDVVDSDRLDVFDDD